MDMYDKIDFLLQEKGASKREMCEAINLSYNTYNSMAKRRSTSVSMEVLQNISNYLEVPVSFLISQTDSKELEFLDKEIERIEQEEKPYQKLLEECNKETIFSEELLLKIYRISEDFGKEKISQIANRLIFLQAKRYSNSKEHFQEKQKSILYQQIKEQQMKEQQIRESSTKTDKEMQTLLSQVQELQERIRRLEEEKSTLENQ